MKSRPRRAESASPPTNEILISIGGIAGHFRFDASPDLMDPIRARYDPFCIPPAPWVDRLFSVRLSIEPPETPRSPAEEGRDSLDTPPTVRSAPDAVEIRRWDFRLLLGRAGERGGSSWSGTGSCRADLFSFDNLLRVLWSVLLSRSGGGLFHACGLRAGDRAFLFPGVSGAGKTTLARKLEDPDDVLSDELVPVRRDRNGRWRIYASPFWGEFQRGRGSLEGCGLASVAFLQKGESLSVSPIPAPEAAQRLLETMLSFEVDRRAVERNLDLAVQLSSEVPCLKACTTLETPAGDLFRAIPRSPDVGQSVPEPSRDNREVISEIRARLRAAKEYAFSAKGTSMLPSIRSGDTVFIRDIRETDVSTGDVLVYWVPGRTPKDDALICHRLLARSPRERGGRFLTKGDTLSSIERFVNGCQGEILGKVVAVSRNGETRPLQRVKDRLTPLLGSLALMPLLKIREALR